MFDNIENLKLAAATRGISKKYSKMQNRKMNAFNLRISGAVCVDFGDVCFDVKAGDLLVMPQGSNYELRSAPNSESAFLTISFYAPETTLRPAVYSLENFSEKDFICNHYAEMWSLGNKTDKYKCYSLFYNLVAYLSNIDHASYSEKRKYDIIEPAVRHMKAHLYDANFKIDELHLLCGTSDTYFRRIFASQFGTTPCNYVINKRLARAESLISEGNFDTINEVASAVGYSDPLYFSRAFKKKYGVSPANMNKEILEGI